MLTSRNLHEWTWRHSCRIYFWYIFFIFLFPIHFDIFVVVITILYDVTILFDLFCTKTIIRLFVYTWWRIQLEIGFRLNGKNCVRNETIKLEYNTFVYELTKRIFNIFWNHTFILIVSSSVIIKLLRLCHISHLARPYNLTPA